MSDSTLALQQAVIAALQGHTPLTTLLGGSYIFDHVPDEQAYPYLGVSRAVTTQADSIGLSAMEHVLQLDAWSGASGKAETYQILSAVHDVLHEAALTLSGYTLSSLRHRKSEILRDPDLADQPYHGFAEYRALVSPRLTKGTTHPTTRRPFRAAFL